EDLLCSVPWPTTHRSASSPHRSRRSQSPDQAARYQPTWISTLIPSARIVHALETAHEYVSKVATSFVAPSIGPLTRGTAHLSFSHRANDGCCSNATGL